MGFHYILNPPRISVYEPVSIDKHIQSIVREHLKLYFSLCEPASINKHIKYIVSEHL